MKDTDIMIKVYFTIDEIIKTIEIDKKPGPKGNLSDSEILTLMVLKPLLRPFKTLKSFHNWIKFNYLEYFPKMPDYTRIKRLFDNYRELIIVIMQKLANLNSFGLIADGTTISVMVGIRGKHAKSFRNARYVYCASKNDWSYGFILETIIDQQGRISFANVGTEAEVKQLENLLEDLKDKWVIADAGNIGGELHERLWTDKQISINITGGKERQWIENVFGFLKENLGIDHIRVRKMGSFLSRVYSILCGYNLKEELNLVI